MSPELVDKSNKEKQLEIWREFRVLGRIENELSESSSEEQENVCPHLQV